MWTARTSIRPAALALLVGCSNPYFIMHEEFIDNESGDEHYLGGDCEQVKDGSQTSTGAGGAEYEYTITHVGNADGVVVIVRSPSGASLREKLYTRDFLLSGKTDELKVRLSDQDQLRLKYWGGEECEAVRDLDD
jgi:hypothetical protein